MTHYIKLRMKSNLDKTNFSWIIRLPGSSWNPEWFQRFGLIRLTRVIDFNWIQFFLRYSNKEFFKVTLKRKPNFGPYYLSEKNLNFKAPEWEAVACQVCNITAFSQGKAPPLAGHVGVWQVLWIKYLLILFEQNATVANVLINTIKLPIPPHPTLVLKTWFNVTGHKYLVKTIFVP